jgi:folate-dependent phosphoribosylglycinamide formyltransferase PurN
MIQGNVISWSTINTSKAHSGSSDPNTQRALETKRPRIALCHLESLVGLPALNALFTEVGGQIELIILSNRFGGKRGGALRQLVSGVKRSGLRMTLWLGFDIVAAQMAWRVARMVRLLTGRAPTLETIRDLAARHGAPIFETNDVNSKPSVELVRRLGIDIVIVMNFDQILKSAFIGAPRLAVVNLHPSLLPAFRGPCPVFWALLEGCQEVGVTIHLIDNDEIDAGPTVVQQSMDLDGADSVGEVTSALFLAGVDSIKTAIDQLVKHGNRFGRNRAERADYRGFPSRAQMAIASRRVPLCRFAHILALVAPAIGWPLPRSR